MKKLISLLLAGLLSLVPVQSTVAATEDVSVGVFLINWLNDTHEDTTKEIAYDDIFGNPRSVAAFYTDTTYGQVSLSGDVFGYYTVNYNSNEPSCNAFNWKNDAINQATTQGIDVASYDKKIFVWDFAGCPYNGKASGNDIYINGTGSHLYTSIIAHELGHTFGLTHADTIRCFDRNGVQVSLNLNRGDTCQYINYGDRYDTMGNSSYDGFNAIHRTMAGWLPQADTQRVISTGTYTLVPLEWSSGVRQLEIVPPKQGKYQPWSLCLEVRQSYGWDQFHENEQYGNPWATNGIHIHLSGSCLSSSSLSFGASTYMIDATPNSPSDQYGPGTQALDYPLPVGQTLNGGGVTITPLTVGTNGASIKVEYPKGNK